MELSDPRQALCSLPSAAAKCGGRTAVAGAGARLAVWHGTSNDRYRLHFAGGASFDRGHGYPTYVGTLTFI
eukprot:2825751-Prymnesium_polylepis.1